MSELTPDKVKRLEEELRIGNILTAKLTDQCRELEAQLAKSPTNEVCPECRGFKRIYVGRNHKLDEAYAECPTCQGTGMGIFHHNRNAPCETCQGTGKGSPDREGKMDEQLREKIAKTIWLDGDECIAGTVTDVCWREMPPSIKRKWFIRADQIIALFGDVRKQAIDAVIDYISRENPDYDFAREGKLLLGKDNFSRIHQWIRTRGELKQKQERERIIKYLRDTYGEVGTSASRQTAYRIAKDLALNLTLEDVCPLKEED